MHFCQSKMSGALVLAAALFMTSAYAKPPKQTPSKEEASEKIDTPVRVTNVTFHGPGCPSGTARASISPDGQVFTVIFDAFLAELNGRNAKKSKTHCQVHANVQTPKGWTYALSSVDYRGYAQLDRGVTATLQSTYQMTGGPKHGSAKTLMQEEYDDGYFIRDTSFDALLWARCGKGDLLKIRTELELTKSKGTEGAGLMAVDTVDGTVQSYQLVWTRC